MSGYWGELARDHWRRHLPERYAALEDPDQSSPYHRLPAEDTNAVVYEGWDFTCDLSHEGDDHPNAADDEP